MRNILYKEFRDFQIKNPKADLDIKEYPPEKIDKIEKKNKNLKSVDSISMHYNLSNFKIIEGMYYLSNSYYNILLIIIIKIILLNYIGNYHCIDHSNATLFRLFEVPKEKEDLIINADSAVQSYWTHIHNNSNHAPPSFKGFNYKSTEAMPLPLPQKALPPPPSSSETSPLPPSLPEASSLTKEAMLASQLENTLPFSQHFGIFHNNNKLVYQCQDYMCKNKADKVGKEYFNHS